MLSARSMQLQDQQHCNAISESPGQHEAVQQGCMTERRTYPVKAVYLLDCHILPSPSKVGLVHLQQGSHLHHLQMYGWGSSQDKMNAKTPRELMQVRRGGVTTLLAPLPICLTIWTSLSDICMHAGAQP